MAEFPLTPLQRHLLLDILARFGRVETVVERRNFYDHTGYSAIPAIRDAVSVELAVRDFCPALLRTLLEQGKLPHTSHHALYPLLRYLRTEVMGHQTELIVIDELLTVEMAWSDRSAGTSRTIPQTPDEKFQTAMEQYRAEQWEQALALFQQLKAQHYRFRSLDQLIQRATQGAATATRRREMLADYKNVVAFTYHPDDIPIAKAEWLAFLQEYRDFSSRDDSEKLIERFKADYLLAMMGDSTLPINERAQAGRELAQVGDPRHGVGLDANGIPDLAWCYVPDEGATPIGGDKDAYQSLPAQKIKVPTFWIAQFPITHQQFQAFIDAPDGYYHQDKQWWQGLAWQEPKHATPTWTHSNHPRATINWYECVAFCRWLTYRLKQVAPRRLAEPSLAPSYRPLWQGLAHGSLVVRLPTEQEWEKATRGKEGWKYGYQSNDPDPKRMNVRETGIGQTSAVGMFIESPSPYGIMDLSGNVWEWVLTTFIDNDNRVVGSAARVLRGGSWNNNAENNARAASRNDNHPENRNDNNGGRAALAAMLCRPLPKNVHRLRLVDCGKKHGVPLRDVK